MRVRVKQGESVCYQGIWYNQAEEFECGDIGNLKGKVDPVESPKKQPKKEEG